jgi:hypothetical protein
MTSTPLQGEPTLKSGWVVFTLIFSIVVMVISGLFVPKGLNWILVALSMLLFMIVLGIRVCGRAWGILINERNLMSLSRFQIVVWTMLILSAYITIALSRVIAGGVSHDAFDPLAIQLDWRLWALMGISTTSLVGTPLILGTKKTKTPADADPATGAPAATAKTARELKEDETEVKSNSEGILYGNRSATDARFSDMFEGDEIGNTAYIDLAKVQMFFFTLLAAVAYAVLVFYQIVATKPTDLNHFPILPDGLIAILAISHGGYLGNKIVDHTKEQP